MELTPEMKECLIEANDEYPDLDWVDTVVEAVRIYGAIYDVPLEFESEEEGTEYFNVCVRFLLDCVLFNMMRDGIVEIDSMDEDGDLCFKLVH